MHFKSQLHGLAMLISLVLAAPSLSAAPELIKADSGPIDLTIKLFGAVMLHPDKALHLHPRYPGVVRQVLKKIGDTVKPGEVLARVENNVGVQTYDLMSTIGGQVIDRQVAVGQSVDEQIEAFTVADTSDVLMSLIAYPRDLRSLKVGQNIKISNGATQADAKISYIAPVLDERSRTAAIHVYVPNPDGLWAPGRNVQAVAVVGHKQAAVRVPVDALIKMIDGRMGVEISLAEERSVVPVVIGVTDDQYAEVVAGLDVGASIAPTKDGHGDEHEHEHEDENKSKNPKDDSHDVD